jgi:hypothetical protein
MNILGVNELLLELTPVTGLAASFGLVPTKSEFKKCDSLFFEKSKGSGVPVTQPAGSYVCLCTKSSLRFRFYTNSFDEK